MASNTHAILLDDNGNPVLARMSNGKWDSTGIPMDPSLSHMRTNVTGQDLEIDAIPFWSANGSENGGMAISADYKIIDTEGFLYELGMIIPEAKDYGEFCEKMKDIENSYNERILEHAQLAASV